MTTENKNYNGWANYETWNVALWLDNDRASYEYWNEVAQFCISEARKGKGNQFAENETQRAILMLADFLKEQIEESAQDMLDNAKQSASMFADLLNGAISEVNFREIAEHYVQEYNS